MGRKMVMVAGLLTNSVTMDTRMHASRVMAHGGRLLRDSIWCPIQVERPELCRPGVGTVRRKEEKHVPSRTLRASSSGALGAGRNPGSLNVSLFPGGRSPVACLIFVMRSFF